MIEVGCNLEDWESAFFRENLNYRYRKSDWIDHVLSERGESIVPNIKNVDEVYKATIRNSDEPTKPRI